MTGPAARFSISPAISAGPSPVQLTMPSHGYVAVAAATDPCGRVLAPPAGVTVVGNIATPHNLPAGTSYVDWKVSPDGSEGNVRTSVILASKQVVGHPTMCAGVSPYGHSGLTPYPHQAASGGPSAVALGGGSLLGLALLCAAVALVWRRRRPRRRGAHRW